MKFKAIFFDFDGVIVDSEKRRLETYRILFHSEFGKDIAFNPKNLIGRAEKENLLYLLEKEKIKNFNLEELRKKRKKILLKEAEKGFDFFKITINIIKYLNSIKFPYLICSNSGKEYIRKSMEKNEIIKPLFILSVEDVIRPKPAPDLFFKCVDILGLDKEEALIVDDSPLWIKESKKYGFKSVGFLSNFNRDELKGAYFYIDPNDHLSVNKFLEMVGINND